MKEIAELRTHYENLKVRFKGETEWYFLNPDTLVGIKIKGNVVKKKTRTWFEKEDKNG